MLSKLISKEELLEVDKLLEQELSSTKSGEYDELYNDLSQDKKQEQSMQSDTEISTDAETEDTIITEHYKALYDDLCIEDFSLVESSKTAFSFLVDTSKVLYSIGLNYGVPLLKNIFKGVLYLINKIVVGLVNSIALLSKFIERNIHSYDNLKQDIQTLRKSLDLLEDTDISELQYTNTRVINSLKISDNTDINANLQILNSFLTDVVKTISNDVGMDIAGIKHLVGYVTSGIVKSPNDLMVSDLKISRLLTSTNSQYQAQNDLLNSSVYDHVLPGDVIYVSYLPKNDIDNIDDITKAYNNSKLFLGFDMSGFKDLNHINYMTTDDLHRLLDQLEHICDTGLNNVSIFKSILDKKKSLKYIFRLYISKLVNTSNKVSVADSLSQQIYLKSMFIDRVYIASMMDINDYTVKVVTNGISFAKANIKALS